MCHLSMCLLQAGSTKKPKGQKAEILRVCSMPTSPESEVATGEDG